jgi:hypothetical protein
MKCIPLGIPTLQGTFSSFKKSYTGHLFVGRHASMASLMYTILRTTTGCSVVFVCKHIYIYYIIHSIDFNSAAVQFPAIILITVIMFICHLLVQPLCPASTALAEATGIPHHFFGGKVVGGCPYNMGSRSVWVSTSLEYSDHLTTIKMH